MPFLSAGSLAGRGFAVVGILQREVRHQFTHCRSFKWQDKKKWLVEFVAARFDELILNEDKDSSK